MTLALKDRIHGHWPLGLETGAISHFYWALSTDVLARLDPARPLLDAIVSASPYLRGLLTHVPEFAAHCLETAPEDVLPDILAETSKSAFLGNIHETAKVLRQCKAKVALLLALVDIGRVWTLQQVTQALTDFADAAVSAAVNAQLLDLHASGKLVLADPARPSHNCGYSVLAMGKHGAGELNYSSDIDLIVLFDPETMPVADGQEPSTLAIRITRKLVSLLQDTDENGYVFRTDLRLRPDPRATQVAIAVEAAANYYENLGQNWERAAYIKARAAAGDIGSCLNRWLR